jgi:four helix bundle protein
VKKVRTARRDHASFLEIGRGTRRALATAIMSADLRERTKTFAISTILLAQRLPRVTPYDVIGRPLVKAATSVAANYRAAERARSRREFIARLGIVREEADESEFWLETLSHCDSSHLCDVQQQLAEASQLRAIFVAALATARGRAHTS